MKKALVKDVIGQYMAIELSADDAVEVLRILSKRLNKGGEDVEDAIRMIQHFDTFYDIMKRKFKEYLTPRKSVSDVIKGNVLVDKIKLIKGNSERRVLLILDRSVDRESVIRILKELGYEVEAA